MNKTQSLCDFKGYVATSEQLNSIIFKIGFLHTETVTHTHEYARKQYREILVHLCRCSRERRNKWKY